MIHVLLIPINLELTQINSRLIIKKATDKVAINLGLILTQPLHFLPHKLL